MQRIVFPLVAATVCGALPHIGQLGVMPGAVVLVFAAIILALAASYSLQALTIGSGAVGAFAFGLLASVSTPVAGAVLVSCCFTERTQRVRGNGMKIAHLGLAAAGGALATALVFHYATADLPVRSMALVVAAVLCSLPLFIEADDPRAFALESAALQLPEPARSSVMAGASVCRTAASTQLDKTMAKQLDQYWKILLKLAETRAKFGHSHGEPPPFTAKRDAAISADTTAPQPQPSGEGTHHEPTGNSPIEGAAANRSPAPVKQEACPNDVANSVGIEPIGVKPQPTATANNAEPPLGEATVAPKHAVIRRLDDRIAEHVNVLKRALSAADAATAAEVSMDTSLISCVRTQGESLEQVAEALMDQSADL